jgi:hypothetical protein
MLFIKSRLTVFDNLPLEVIRTFILPHLNYEERIHLNRCLPAQDRFSRKMNSQSIVKHDQDVAISTVRIRMMAADELLGFKKYKNMIALFKILQGRRCFKIIQENPGFREVAMTKIIQLTNDLIQPTVAIDLDQRLKLTSEIKKLRRKIEISGPYGPRVTYNDVASLRFQ